MRFWLDDTLQLQLKFLELLRQEYLIGLVPLPLMDMKFHHLQTSELFQWFRFRKDSRLLNLEQNFSAYNEVGHDVFQLNIATVLRRLGRNAFNKIGDLKLSGYLADLEERYQTVLYLADSPVTSPWTKHALHRPTVFCF